MPTVTLAAMTDVSAEMARGFLACGDWMVLQRRILEEGRLPQKSLSGRSRAFAEIRYRLRQLSEEQLGLLGVTELVTQRLLIHLAACRAYPFLHEFTVQVLREKAQVRDFVLNVFDFERFWEQQALTRPQVARLGEVSRKQIRRAVFRFLAEVGLTSSSRVPRIQAPWVSPELARAVCLSSPELLKVFLLSDRQIREML